MKWTAEKLTAFKAHFNLTDRQIAKGISVNEMMIWKARNDVIDISRYDALLTGYLEAVRAGKVKEAEKMIEYYKSF